MSYSAELFLFRHGEALNNVEKNIIIGRGDHEPLTELGEDQAGSLGDVLALASIVPDVVYSSPAIRSIGTCEFALQKIGLSDYIIDERLHEQHTGDWTGMAADKIFTDEMVKTIEASGKDFRSPNGESMNDVGDRMQSWADDVSEAGIVFAFTHGGSVRCLISRYLNWTHEETYALKPPNTSVSTIRKQIDGPWVVDLIAVKPASL